jgi:hypothetical protein
MKIILRRVSVSASNHPVKDLPASLIGYITSM